ncbi:MAG: type II toxin-antitoxin system RelE/ParE family toxin [Janthinobacterium lividum]
MLLAALQQRPQTGESLGRNCYKVRVKIKSKNTGKRGGARAITCVKLVGETICLLAIYDKADQDTISDKEIDAILSKAGIK